KPVHEGRVLATGALRIAHDIRVVAEEFQIDHTPRVPGPPDRHSRPAAPCHMNATPSTPNTTPATKSTHGPTATMRRTTASVDTASAMQPNPSTDVPHSARMYVNCTHHAAPTGMNCASTAVKNSTIFGFDRLVRTPCRYDDHTEPRAAAPNAGWPPSESSRS